LVKTLLAAGAKVNAEKDAYPVPIHNAISSGSEACVKLLIEAKADVNTRVGQYESPLSLAATAGSAVLVKLLLDAGAKPGTPWVLATALTQQQQSPNARVPALPGGAWHPKH
jgi:ankyrin repeat protein